MTTREERFAANEALFRSLNERITDVLHEIGDTSSSLDVVCECANEGCEKKITMTHDDYEKVRSQPTHFVVVNGHVVPDIEGVVGEGRGFEIVEKHGEEARIARATDPRR